MNTNLLIIDDFYVDPEVVRQQALNSNYDVEGNYPGRRSKPHLNDSILQTIQKLVYNSGGKITRWDLTDYNGSFQFTTCFDRSWIHADQTTIWAGVCYLTPDAPLSGGTGLFMHKKTGLFAAPRKIDGSYDMELLSLINKDSQDMTKWELTDRVANRFNRLILYRGDNFHMSLDYFGNELKNARLFQTFFFDTEY
jgi:hypothetical protein